MAQARRADLSLFTTLIRQDNGGTPVVYDAIVHFEAEMTAPATRQTRTDPAWPAEFEVTFDRAELDVDPADAPEPLTAIEIETLRAWFAANEAKALECANDNAD